MKFAVIAPFDEIAIKIKKVCKELQLDVPIIVGDLNNGVTEVKKLIDENYNLDVIVSRGGTAKLIESLLDIPVISIEISTIDMIEAILEAKKLGTHIGVIGFKNIVSNSKKIGEYLNVKVEELVIENSFQLMENIDYARSLGVDVIVGDNVSVTMCQKEGIKSVRVASGEEAIESALKKADEFSRMRRRETIGSNQLKTILGAAYEGIIATDVYGKITLVNDNAEKILSKSREELLGSSIYCVASKEVIDTVTSSGNPVLGDLYRLKKDIIVQNLVPIKLGDSVVGIVITMSNADDVERVERKVRHKLYLKGHVAQYNFCDIMTDSCNMKKVIEKAELYAKTDFTILITGESGTGKEMLAQSIHNKSWRANNLFVAINSAAMPENLLESELFGYEEGAFTGARKGGKKGLFELAHNGTLFLDEIGDLSLKLQARLLRVLQEKTIMRVGGDTAIAVNVRVIAATHKNLEDAVEAGDFRRDLYYRLNVLRLIIPSLNERKQDIPKLVKTLSSRISEDLGISIAEYTEDVIECLQMHNWKGNIRELENILLRLNIIRENNVITIEDLIEIFNDIKLEKDKGAKVSVNIEDLDIMGKNIISHVLNLTNNDKDKTCQILNISKTTLWRRLKENNE